MKITGVFLVLTAVASAAAVQLPFLENFDALSEGSLDFQNGWVVQEGTAVVQANVVQNSQALELTAASVTHDLSSSNSALWLTFWAYYQDTPDVDPLSPTQTLASPFTSTRTVIWS